MSVFSARKHGLFAHRLFQQVSKYLGVTYMPYYVIREGHVPLDGSRHLLPEEYSVSQLQPGEHSRVAGLNPWTDDKEIRNRLAAGHICTVICKYDTVAGYTWADLNSVNDRICDYPLPPGHAYLYDAFITPQFRGAGLASMMRAVCYQHLRGQGVQGFVSISDRFNTPALKFKKRLGGEPIALYQYLAVGSRVLLNRQSKQDLQAVFLAAPVTASFLPYPAGLPVHQTFSAGPPHCRN